MTASIACFPLLLWLHSHSASLLTGLSTLWHASVRSVSSITQSCPALSDPMDCRHTKLHCPSPAPGAYSGSYPSSWWCHPTISSSVIPFSSRLQSFPHQGLFQWVSSSHQVAKMYWYFAFSISPSNEYLGLISFKINWLDLLAVQGTLKSLLQHHSSKESILRELQI